MSKRGRKLKQSKKQQTQKAKEKLAKKNYYASPAAKAKWEQKKAAKHTRNKTCDS